MAEDLKCRLCGIEPKQKTTESGSYFYECPHCHDKSIAANTPETARMYWRMSWMRRPR